MKLSGALWFASFACTSPQSRGKAVEDVGEFLLCLYRIARECDLDLFQSMALARLNESLEFAGAFWGAARTFEATGIVVPTALFARNVDPEFLIGWSQIQQKDRMSPMLLKQPGKTILASVPKFYKSTPEFVEFGLRHRIQSMAVIAMPNPIPSAVEWLSLYRGRPDAPYTDSQVRWLDFVAPHLAEAWRINLAIHSATIQLDGPETGVAVADAMSGRLLCADPRFLAMLGSEWSGFDGRQVPTPLKKAWAASRNFLYLTRRGRIDGRASAELVYLSSRPKSSTENLTQRQLQVAQLYAQGLPSKRIADMLGLSLATVRNHVATAYSALGVHDKVHLARSLESMTDLV